MRGRYIKVGFFENDLLSECDPLARLLFAGLWMVVDCEGRVEDRPRYLRGQILRYDTCDANELLEQLAQRGFIQRYEVDGVRVIQVVKYLKHQYPDGDEKKKGSSLPPPPGGLLYEKLPKSLGTTPEVVQENTEGSSEEPVNVSHTLIREDVNTLVRGDVEERAGTGKPGRPRPPIRPKRFTPPSLDDVADYVTTNNLQVDPVRFIDYYVERGWKLSKGCPMVDWKAAIRNWGRRELKAAPDKHVESRTAAIESNRNAWLNNGAAAHE